MKITAAICTYNREKYLPQLFESISKQSLSYDQFEVVLVDNNSPGNTRELCDQFQIHNPNINFRYFLETNQGLSFARNRCIAETRNDLITFLDDDAFITQDYLEKKLYYFKEYKNVCAIGSKILLHFEEYEPKWSNPYINQILGFYDLGDKIKELNSPDYPRGSNMTFRTDLFDKIGGFNVELGRIGANMLGGEEKDLFARIYSQNDLKVLYVPDAIVNHCVPPSRLSNQFVKNQALGIGRSERIRTRNISFSKFIASSIKEIIKWAASILISFKYLIQCKPQAGWMILKFRFWVSLGLFGFK
ncbi:MAG: glycosyltransferase [Bacteroidetes bacterium]|nr:glycosyltransferase [Bacteroidota bacterium]